MERSGHSVAWFMNNKSIDISGFKQSILALGCSHEGFPLFSLGAIDVPPDVNFDLLNDIIDLYEELGLDFAFPIWNDPNQ
nr:hypothetical protein [Algibacillus agarilyticus]